MNLIQLAECGWLPDSLIRIGIRRLLKKRIAKEDLGSVESNQARLQELLDSFRTGPIALVPEKANEQHYEVPAAFFELVLGKRKKYSSCWYPTGTETLDEAEEFALNATCERADIHDGMSILELGCGWGSLTLWMAEHYPNSEIVAVSNSTSQREHILDVAQQKGIDRNLTVLTRDMNEFDIEDNRFDRVVSVEMFEHMHNYEALLKNVSRWLRPDGKLFVHIFCHRHLTYLFKDEGREDWMSRYFFSGGTMPGHDMLLRFSDDMSCESQWSWKGTHYHLTCEDWLKNADRNKDAIMKLFRETYGGDAAIWFQRWRMFFLACSELFRMHEGNEWYVSHYRFQNRKSTPKPNSESSDSRQVPLS